VPGLAGTDVGLLETGIDFTGRVGELAAGGYVHRACRDRSVDGSWHHDHHAAVR
jgi:hypothetical protein